MRARRYRGEYREVAGAIAMRSKLTTLEFNLSIDDYAEFSVYYTLHSRFGRKLGGWLLVSSIGPVAVLLSLALGIYPHLYEQAGGVLGLIFLAIVLSGMAVTLSWITRPFLTRFIARRRFRDGTFDAYAKPQTVEICAAGVKFSGSAGESLIPWPSIVEIGTTRQAIYFFVNSLNAYIVPRRAFSNEANYDEFVRCALGFRRPHAV
jgi:YcxB-like protein